MRRLLPFMIALALLAAGCDGADSSDEPAGSTATTSSTEPTTTITPDDDASAIRLVVATEDGSAEVRTAEGDLVLQIRPESGVITQPTWLDVDSVVYTTTFSTGRGSLVAVDAVSGAEVWEVPMDTPPFYFLPAPRGSDYATTSLRNSPDLSGLVAELISPDGTSTVVSEASPFYASWSPSGDRLVTHTQQNVLAVESESGTEVIAEGTGAFQAPSWTEDGIVTLRTVDGVQYLTVWDDGEFRDAARVDGPVRFVAAEGRVAIQSTGVAGGVDVALRAQDLPTIPPGRLAVVDLASGEVETVTGVLTPMFQWDASGDRLLYASFDDGSSLDFTWHIWDDGQVVDYAPFEAQPRWFRDLVPFFDQYDQSVSLWSPAGDAFAYPALEDGNRVVVIQPVDGGERTVIEGATWVSWERRS